MSICNLKNKRYFCHMSETSLVQQLANGCKAYEIAATEKKSIHAVKRRIERIKKRCHAANTPHLVAIFMRKKLIE